jgi:hypothetical protein
MRRRDVVRDETLITGGGKKKFGGSESSQAMVPAGMAAGDRVGRWELDMVRW